MRLTRYLSVSLVRMALTATFILAFIAQILDLVDNAGDILDQGDGLYGILRYVVLRMPTLLTRSLPLGALVGATLVLLLLARNSEIVAMRSAGRSTSQLFLSMLPGALALVLFQSTLIDVVAPHTEARLAILLTQRIDRQADEASKNPKATWLRIGDAVVSFDRVSERGRRLRSVRIYDRDQNKIVTARTTAAEARYRNGRWTLKDAERVLWTRENFNERTPADGVWETSLTPDDVLSSLTPESRVSLAAARAVLAGEMTPNAPLPFYQTLIERVYAGPLGVIVMVLLAMPAALVNWRDARTGRRGVLAMTAGLIFLLSDGLLTTLALTGVVSPAIGAWSALVVFAIYGAYRIFRIDGGWPSRATRAQPVKRLAEAKN
ncbi:LptF/LptG family permease [Hansschlegelia beijingensis]|uniref:LptF/LptG family permease n=1 Tax=Hansschlegelia beijingensis TaxID=1133344 RepID=UPI00387F1DBE